MSVLKSVELGVRRVVYLHVARLHRSRFFRLRGIARDWKDSYPVVLVVKHPAKSSVSSWYQSASLITVRERTTSWHVDASRRVGVSVDELV